MVSLIGVFPCVENAVSVIVCATVTQGEDSDPRIDMKDDSLHVPSTSVPSSPWLSLGPRKMACRADIFCGDGHA